MSVGGGVGFTLKNITTTGCQTLDANGGAVAVTVEDDSSGAVYIGQKAKSSSMPKCLASPLTAEAGSNNGKGGAIMLTLKKDTNTFTFLMITIPFGARVTDGANRARVGQNFYLLAPSLEASMTNASVPILIQETPEQTMEEAMGKWSDQPEKDDSPLVTFVKTVGEQASVLLDSGFPSQTCGSYAEPCPTVKEGVDR